MKHTPTPWQVDEQGNVFYPHGEERHVCCGNGINGDCCGNPEREVDWTQVLVAKVDTPDTAAFIVRACNAHEELVAALKAIGAAHTQHNLLSTGTDEERRAYIERVITAWNDLAVPALNKVGAPS